MNFDPSKYSCYLFDLDGTVYVKDQPVQGTVEYIRTKLQDKAVFYLTNNTAHTPLSYKKKLSEMGLQVHEDNILTPLAPLIRALDRAEVDQVVLLATTPVRDYLSRRLPEVNFQADPREAAGVVMCYDTSLDYSKICAVNQVLQRRDAFYWATHLDKICPTPEGGDPDCGSFAAMFRTASGRDPQRVFGKPSEELLAEVCARYSKKDIVFSGDRLYTDMELAHKADIDFVLVLSGESDVRDAATLPEAPQAIVSDWGDFL